MLIGINAMRVFLYFKKENRAVLDAGVRFPESDKYGEEDVVHGARTLATV